MHPELIKAEIRMRGTTPAAIADELGVTRTAVAQVIECRMKSARIRAHIARLLGKSEAELWSAGTKPPLRRMPQPSKKQLRREEQYRREQAAGVRP